MRKRTPPPITSAGEPDAGPRSRWPKSARVAGTEQELNKLLSIPGITVDDHGQRKLGPGRWQVTVNAANQAAVDELSRLGFTPLFRDPIVVDRHTIGLLPPDGSRD